MNLSHYSLTVLCQDSEFVLCRGRAVARPLSDPRSVLVSMPAAEHPPQDRVRMLEHELALRTELDSGWAVRPLALVQYEGRAALVLEDAPGEPLELMLRQWAGKRAMDTRAPADTEAELVGFLRIAIGLTNALGEVHARGILHKNVKPSHCLINAGTGQAWLTGFGIASRLQRERQAPDPPETIAGTLAYMAPEQTGRMNRSIDARSDLYTLGVNLYQMLTGSLPFAAKDPMEWVHCHIARQPIPPCERIGHIAPQVSAIVMKLLAKTAEDRYQTAAGLEHDLRSCLARFEGKRCIGQFPLGDRDTPDQLLIPERLYGREREVETLLATFDGIVRGGPPQLVLVSGYAGIGKSSVVNELQKALVPPRGLFASGKFDQYKRDIPYSTLAQALQTLVRGLLAKRDAELEPWREALREGLGPNARLVTELVPELTLLIGEQPPIPPLPPQDARGRFQLVFRRFIGVFARPEHPLVLFVDDLQWLDAATLDLMESLLTGSELQYLLLIGAYRDHEVTPAHPLLRTLQAIRSAGAAVHEIVLAPLARQDLGCLVADALHCDLEAAGPLAVLILEKTAGNPFFANQFLSDLAEEGLLAFDRRAARWSWNLDRIRAKGYTDNVVDLMVGKLSRLPTHTRAALQQLACLGNLVDAAIVRMVEADSTHDLHNVLQEALRTGLLLFADGSYRFLHDRVQEATYSLIPQEQRADAHLRIGRRMAAQTPPDLLEDRIFEVVNQLNRASHLITSTEERERTAELNLIAGRRAKASTAYASALNYFAAGAALLREDRWQRRRELTFSLELHRAECEFLTAELEAAEQRLKRLASLAVCPVEQAAVASLRVDLHTTLAQSDGAVAVCFDFLHRLHIAWPPHPTQEDVRGEYEQIWAQLEGRPIEALIDLPLMSDPDTLATLDVLVKVLPPALHTDTKFLALAICRMVNLSLERGNGDGSCFGYVWLGMIAGPLFGDYQAGFRFGQLGYELVEQRGLKRFQAATYMSFGSHVLPWTRHVRAGRHLVRRAFEVANQTGDLTFATYCCENLNRNLLTAGDPLAEVQREAESGLAFARKAGFGHVVDQILGELAFIRTLRGATPTFGSFDGEGFDEAVFERHLASNVSLQLPECWYWIMKLQARFLAGDFGSAVEASLRAERLLWTSPSHFPTADFHFYSALAHAASCTDAPAEQRSRHWAALTAHHEQLQIWAENCPENFETRAALVRAEMARIEGREWDAQRLYEDAIRSAAANEFVNNQALACELAARFYLARGLDDIGALYLRKARHCYRQWGAGGKVRQLDQGYTRIREEERVNSPTSTITASNEGLDLATVIKVSQAVSGEIILDKLIDTLMRIAMEHAGAERALLILLNGSEERIAAEATTSNDTVVVRLLDEPVTGHKVPETVLRYVLHTRESVILDDATKADFFATDPYVRNRNARSVLCLPLANQARLIGALYLENNLAPRVFAPARATVLKLLASQAAISIENGRLYCELAEREARIRRLVDANIIGILIWKSDGRILEANDAFLAMLGYERSDLAMPGLRWTDLTPPEWRHRDERLLPELERSGTLQPFEKEFYHKDGSRVPVLIGVARFNETGTEGVAFVLSLTERKRAEEALTRAGAELAHVSRVTALSALTASIAHEVNQPLSGIITNAGTCVRMLDAVPPNVDGARETARRTIRDGNRAAEVITRLRALFGKREFTAEPLDLNEATREVIALLANDLQRNRIVPQADLTEDLPMVTGDRIQLQQVILNLLRNAADAMAEIQDRPRALVISTDRWDGDQVRLSVRDVGVGLSPETSGRLFDAFYTTKNGGMGIGLFVSRSIIIRHNGRLWAEPNDGPGATFVFSIPCGPASLSDARTAQRVS